MTEMGRSEHWTPAPFALVIWKVGWRCRILNPLSHVKYVSTSAEALQSTVFSKWQTGMIWITWEMTLFSAPLKFRIQGILVFFISVYYSQCLLLRSSQSSQWTLCKERIQVLQTKVNYICWPDKRSLNHFICSSCFLLFEQWSWGRQWMLDSCVGGYPANKDWQACVVCLAGLIYKYSVVKSWYCSFWLALVEKVHVHTHTHTHNVVQKLMVEGFLNIFERRWHQGQCSKNSKTVF